MIIQDDDVIFDKDYEEANGMLIVLITGVFLGTALAGFILFESLKADVVDYLGQHYLEAHNCQEVFMESESLTEYQGQYITYKCEVSK